MERIAQITPSLAEADGTPTIRVDVVTERGFQGTVTLPSGISVGSDEAAVVQPEAAIQAITEHVAPPLIGKDCLEQRELDLALMALDPTPRRTQLGANSLLAISLASVRAAAAALSREPYEQIAELAGTSPRLPTLVQVILEGGKHGMLNSGLGVQELSVIGETDQARVEQLLATVERLLTERGLPYRPGAEGGIAPAVPDNVSGLKLLWEAFTALGWTSPRVAIDVAASHGSHDISELQPLFEQFPVELLEDPLDQTDLAGWQGLTAELGETMIIAADDLTVGDPSRIKDAVKSNVANGLVLKLNQVGTLSELLDLIALVKVGNWRHILSHRGHESADDLLIDLAVGTGAEYLKLGTPRSAVRASKFARYAALLGRTTSGARTS